MRLFLILCLLSSVHLSIAQGIPKANMTGVTTSVLLATPNVLPAFAPSNPVNATFTWSVPILNDDGSAISLPLSYQVYMGPPGAPLVRMTVPLSAQTFGITGGPEVFVPGSTYCFAVTAIQNGVESLQSAQACVRVPFAVPGSPAVSVHT